jgi:SOS-response transcriptional repressor LexA
MTRRQQDVLSIIGQYIDRYGVAPTLREIGGHLGVSTTTAHEHVRHLTAKGILVRAVANTARGIAVAGPEGFEEAEELARLRVEIATKSRRLHQVEQLVGETLQRSKALLEENLSLRQALIQQQKRRKTR